jgi:hypothetical protein
MVMGVRELINLYDRLRCILILHENVGMTKAQLSNSNKYMSYREGYLLCPLLLTLQSGQYFQPASTATSADYAFGLKSWFGQIIHSFTLDYNGTTI